ncbi:MAG: hypothetical protein GYB31_10360 [Bacteroidetes bacterium]|nr:hypothetical protein [Bacteroidota bacterium]
MRILASFLIILCMPFIYSSAKSAEEARSYCNDRFGFCVEYPENLFTQVFIPDNGDGVLLQSEDGKYKVQASGSYNLMDWEIEDIYYFTFEDFSRESSGVKNLDSVFTETEYEATFLVDDQLRYYHTFLFADSYITLTIVVPKGEDNILNSLKDEVGLRYNI